MAHWRLGRTENRDKVRRPRDLGIKRIPTLGDAEEEICRPTASERSRLGSGWCQEPLPAKEADRKVSQQVPRPGYPVIRAPKYLAVSSSPVTLVSLWWYRESRR